MFTQNIQNIQKRMEEKKRRKKRKVPGEETEKYEEVWVKPGEGSKSEHKKEENRLQRT